MRIAFVTNHDWFFMSHRLPLAMHALERGDDVYLLAIDTGKRQELEQLGIHFVPIPLNPTGTNPFEDLRCVFTLTRLYTQIKPDIIHHITIKTTLLGCIAAKLSRQRHVVNAISGFGYAFTDGRQGLMQKVAKVAMRMAFSSKHFSFILQNPDDFNTIKEIGYVPETNLYLIKEDERKGSWKKSRNSNTTQHKELWRRIDRELSKADETEWNNWKNIVSYLRIMPVLQVLRKT